MAVAAVSNSGTNGSKAKNFSSMFGGLTWAKGSGGTESTQLINGINYKIHQFTATAAMTISNAGYADLLVVGGGGGSVGGYGGGGAGCVRYGIFYIPAGSYTATVGGGGGGIGLSPTQIASAGGGGGSSFGSILSSGGGGGGAGANYWPGDFTLGSPYGGGSGGAYGQNENGTAYATGGGQGGGANGGVVLNYNGTSTEYGQASRSSPPVNTGSGSIYGESGASGIVILRYAI